MRNIYFYYLAILSPLALMILLMKMYDISSWIFILFLFTYTIIYRTYIDGIRLVSKGVIDKSEIWKMVYKGRKLEYLKELYLN